MKNKSKNIQQEIRLWEKSTNEIAEQWIIDYFELSEEEVASGIDYYWIGDEFAKVFEFADYYIDFSNVLDCYKLNVSKEQFFDWYNKTVESNLELSLSDFMISPKKLKEKEEKHLKELKNRLEYAENELFKALNQYGKPEDVE